VVDRSLANYGLFAKRKESEPSCIEFFGQPSLLHSNIIPKKNGDVYSFKIGTDMYCPDHRMIQVLVVDDDNTALRNIILEETEEDLKQRDVRLSPGLDLAKHFTETRKVICLQKGEEYVIKDFTTAEYEPYETLEEPFNLYRAIANNREDEVKDKFLEFAPLSTWGNLTMETKLGFYDKYCCHEVNLFVYNKDKEFFSDVVLPLLKSKTQKTFMDKYFLGEDLKAYKDPHRFYRLNSLEKVLLASRVNDADLKKRTLAFFKERSELTNIDPQLMDERFDLGIKSRELGVEELDRQMEIIEQTQIEEMMNSGEGNTNVLALDKIRKSFSGVTMQKEEYLSMTRQFVENQYYNIQSDAQTTDLVPPTRFWNAYADWCLAGAKGAFLTEWYQLATGSLNEILLALAVLDLPLDSEDPDKEYLENGAVKVVAHSPVIVYVRELVETTQTQSALSVSMNYFDPSELTHMVDGQEVDKFIAQFTTNHVYGCRMVVTNVSSFNQRVEIVSQIPSGAIAIGKECFKTQAWFQDVNPFGTYRREFFFYWPQPGTFTHFPVHINKNGKTVGFGKSQGALEVQTSEPVYDTSSWKYISQKGTDEELVTFLNESPEVMTANLEKMCWRLKDEGLFAKVCNALKSRRIYNEKVWAYSLISDKSGEFLGEFLASNQIFREYAGPALKCKLVNVDLKAARENQIIEYWPLLNPRTHDVEISFQEFEEQYYNFLTLIAFDSTSISDIKLQHKLILCFCLLTRNQYEEAKTVFDLIDEKEAQEACPMVYNYFKVYISFLGEDPAASGDIAEQYVNQPLPASLKAVWRSVLETLAEMKDPTISDAIFLEEEERKKQEAAQPAMSFKFLKNQHSIEITYRNISSVTVNYYATDLEVLFSAHPFQESNTSYKLMIPNATQIIDLEADSNTKVVALPEEARDANTILELKSGVLCQTELYNDNQLEVCLAEDEGELRVIHKKSKEPIESAYCKVYGMSLLSRKSEFFKDGYSDIRGRFNYRELSTDQLRQVSRLSILVQTESLGSVIKECDMPLAFRSSRFI